MLFRMEDGALGTVTAVDPPKVWEPPSCIPDRHGNYVRRVLGTIKHKGFAVLDVTFGGQTVTTSPDHPFWSASREAWVPVGSMRPGELLRNVEGDVIPVEAISPPRYGFIELYNLEIEDFHTFFVGSGGSGSALVHNGQGNYIKKPAVPTEEDHVKGVKAPGRYNATVGSEEEATRIVRTAMPDAVEVPPAVAGQPYPIPEPGVKKWFQVQPPEPEVGNNLPHVKYEDWTRGKKKTDRHGFWGPERVFPPRGGRQTAKRSDEGDDARGDRRDSRKPVREALDVDGVLSRPPPHPALRATFPREGGRPLCPPPPKSVTVRKKTGGSWGHIFFPPSDT